MYDLVTFGHSTVDVFLKVPDAELRCDVDHENCKICFNFADKIPVESFHREIGGNAPNSSIGAARLGLKVSLVSSIGNDANGIFVLEKLRKEGVLDLQNITKDNLGTDYSTIINFKGERTILAFHEKRQYVFPKDLAPSKWGYLSSMGEDFSKFNATLLDWVKTNNTKLAFNPGMYELKAPLSKIKNVLANTYLLILNKDEALEILPNIEKTDIKTLLNSLHNLGPSVVIITDANKGSYAFDGDKYLKMATFPAPRTEMTGAGDSFSAGVLCGLISGEKLEEALRWGTANAASVIQHIGAIKGLLDMKGLKKMLDEHSNIVPSIF